MMGEDYSFSSFKAWFDQVDQATQAETLAALGVDEMFADHAEANAWLDD